MVVLTAACLLSLVASILRNIVPDTQSAKLQAAMISLASRRNIFGVPNFSSSYLQGLQDPNAIWKVWGRINSGKRLIAALIIVEAHSAQAMQLPPQCPNTVQIPVLSWDENFSTYGFEEWSASSESIEMSLGDANGNISQSGFGLQATLAGIWTKILHKRHRLLESFGLMDDHLHQPLSNDDLFSKDSQAKSMANNFVALYGQDASDFTSDNTNFAILWNFLGLHLYCNLSVIKLAAGRNGPVMAREAMDSLST
ncbi:hypothetical protein TMatcc_004244 [Talaromyces marneffei ATCC 18224]|uniref:uncharacterized protein n=1 Tax=Talaromyces marneffei TaxID=37727 RepID=UPI0012A8C5E5|nr:uncharacterized protein EYB26_000794 [Talaromyces marneffei]KAE8556836.1 hypothetical protein EYB25_001540 [Talaromyces marneffei]QGA13147.1 hypothetical protein EYB26_000794 [Talaromyces marneffei]